jgi:Ca2+-binding RTX toxin-like protein
MPVQFKFGTERSDWLYGADGDDWYLNGYGGDDHLYGAGGDDILWGGKGADYLDGGREQEDGDTADYSSSDAAVIVNLHSNVGHGYGGEADAGSCHRIPQSSSPSRFTAGTAGFLNFSQSGKRPDL